MKILFILFVAIAMIANSVKAQTTAFYYATGPKWSYVAQGSATITPQDGWSFNPMGYANPNDPNWSAASFSLSNNPQASQWWSLSFEGIGGHHLTTGTFTATRYPFEDPSLVGFDWSGNGRGCNTSTTKLVILDVQYGAGGTITSLAVDFTQFEETWGNLSPDPATYSSAYGSFRYNSSVPLNVNAVPEPSTSALILAPAAGLGLCRKRKQ